MKLRVPLPLLIAFVLGMLAESFRAQDPIQPPPTAAAAMPASVRAVGPFTHSTPGIETQFGFDPADPTHVYVYHANDWHPFRIDTIP